MFLVSRLFSCLILLTLVFLILPGPGNTIKRHMYETDFDYMVKVNFHLKRACYIWTQNSDLAVGFIVNVRIN